MSNTVAREVLVFTPEQCRMIVYGDDSRFSEIEDVIVGHSRWSVDKRIVVKRESDGKFFESCYSIGATESQDQVAYEYDDPKFTEVFAVEKTITVYE